jgi:hypothetical protein
VKLSYSGIAGILRNEKYSGDMLLQKSYVNNHIEKRKIINRGELPKYFVSESHEAIIPKDEWLAVQNEIARRGNSRKISPKPETHYAFTGIIRCGKCGSPFKRKHTAAGTKYEKIVWICPTFDHLGKAECDSQQIPEAILEVKVAEVLGIPRFDELQLHTFVTEIRVPERNRLIFVFQDGHEIEISWENPSRRESWTPEKREKARQRALYQHHGA